MTILSGYCWKIIHNNLAVGISGIRKTLLSLLKNFLLEVPEKFKDYFVPDGKMQMLEHKQAKYLTGLS